MCPGPGSHHDIRARAVQRVRPSLRVLVEEWLLGACDKVGACSRFKRRRAAPRAVVRRVVGVGRTGRSVGGADRGPVGGADGRDRIGDHQLDYLAAELGIAAITESEQWERQQRANTDVEFPGEHRP